MELVAGARLRRAQARIESMRPYYADAKAIAHKIIDLYSEGDVDSVVIVYNHFESPLVQRVVEQEILPIPESIFEDDDRERALVGDFIYEPEPEQILERLLPVYVETELYRALLESAASEQGARMTAMRNASKNAAELIDNLTLAMNRARQAEITQEILEVVAGADAPTPPPPNSRSRRSAPAVTGSRSGCGSGRTRSRSQAGS